MLLHLDVSSTNTAVLLVLLVLGLGLGSGVANFITITQNALPDKLRQMSAAVTFFRQFGGAIGVISLGKFRLGTAELQVYITWKVGHSRSQQSDHNT
ncbi:MAG: hypothetical protein ACLQUY_04525 [Ktedonobacterales bacterium]